MPLQATSGAASYDAFGGGVAAVPNYIEECFSAFLYTGNGSTQTITNGIDLAGDGGLVWLKCRNSAENNEVYDTVRGANQRLITNTTGAQVDRASSMAFSSTGLSWVGDNISNTNGNTYASWTFRKQPKFFDVVTFTGTQNYGGSGQTVSHNLGSTPACIIIKPLSDTSGSGFTLNNWIVYHRGLSSPTTQHLKLNSTASIDGNSDKIKAVSDTTFTAGWEVGLNGIQYVAYIFAHNAGGFGLTGTDNVISCGSYTGTGSVPNNITLGFEPQWLLVKSATYAGQEWGMFDSMRGLVTGSGGDAYLYANSSGAEGSGTYLAATATGFSCEDASARYNNSGDTYIYIAIRRGPMKVPTSGTSVFETVTSSATAGTVLTTGFPVDLQMQAFRSTTGAHRFMDRLRGVSTNSTAGSISLASTSDAAETSTGSYSLAWNNTGFQMTTSFESTSGVFWNFRRAPSFFDEVCYTGNSTAGRAINHNLGVAPELLIVKRRSGGVDSWYCYAQPLGNTYDLSLDSTRAASNADDIWYSTSPTSTTFTVRQYDAVNGSGYTYVAYLFATCAGVSKVGSYTGTGTTKQVDCGFTGGARFVLIKRTDSTGDWYVWDSARGIVSGNDPYLLLNSTAAEVTSTDYIDTYSAGFEISSTAPAAINASGGTFIFLAIA